VIVVRKLSAPFRPEFVIGAIGEGGVSSLNQHRVRLARLSASDLAEVEQRARAQFVRMERLYRSDRPPVGLGGRTAVVVDDGIDTCSTVRVACQVARARGAARVVLAVPVAPPTALDELSDDADTIVCLETPEPFLSIRAWYGDPTHTRDDEAVDLLRQADPPTADHPPLLTRRRQPMR
jgi:putative phosphoribosyl transferase